MIKKWFIFPIYLVRYDLRVNDEDKSWYSKKYNKWVNLNYDDNLSSSKRFKNKSKAFKEFDKLTKRGINCTLNDRCIILGKGWYFRYSWESKDQNYFNLVNKD